MAISSQFPKLIGVIHLPPLAGAPDAGDLTAAEALDRAGARAIEEARALERAGFQGLILENYGDGPFYKSAVPAETLASMAVIAGAISEVARIPVGLNFLRNDALAALAAAAVTRCDFIRVNVLNGVVATDQGLIEGCAAELIRKRRQLGGSVKIFADAQVKHAKTLSGEDLGAQIEDLVLRGRADAVIVTGKGTGKPVDSLALQTAGEICRKLGAPLYVGSGASVETLPELASSAYGVIVSSALRRGREAGAPLHAKNVSAFVRAFRSAFLRPAKKAGKKPRR